MNTSQNSHKPVEEKLTEIINNLSQQEIIDVYRMFNCIIFALQSSLKEETFCTECKEGKLLLHIFENAKLIYVKTLYSNNKLESILINNGQPK